MTFAAAHSPVGFKKRSKIETGDEYWLPGVAGSAITAGDQLSKNGVGANSNAGLFIRSTDSLVPVPFVAKKAMTVAAATVGFPVAGPGSEDYRADVAGTARDTLIPCEYVGPTMGLVEVALGNYTDDVLAAYTAATPSVTLTVALGANDDPNGAFIYVYAGAGAGQWNWIVDYVDSTKVCTLARRFAVAPDTTSYVIILEGEGSSKGGLGTYGRADSYDHDTMDVADGVDDGDWICMVDGWAIGEYLRRGCLPFAKLTLP